MGSASAPRTPDATVRITLATFEGMPAEFDDDEVLVAKLRERGARVDYVPWSDPKADWASADLVYARSPWDYPTRHSEFVEWVRGVRAPLENAPELIVWNSDKRYLADLAAEGLPVVETAYVAPGGSPPEIDSEVVIKPTISAGARRTGRFGPASADLGRELITRITADGGTAMIQPFLGSVEAGGETAVVLVAGEVSHALHKRALLAADQIAPIRDDGLGVAEVMYDPDLVVAGAAEADELELSARVLAAVEHRFGTVPLIARVDMLRDERGNPVLLELEAIEPNLYFAHAPGAADRLADAIVARATGR